MFGATTPGSASELQSHAAPRALSRWLSEWRGSCAGIFRESPFQGDEDLVFPHPHTGHPLDASKLRKRFKETLERAELRPIRFHDLRHTFGTHCASAGVPLRTLQEWLGHRDFKTTLVYADYAPSPHEADLLERAFQREKKGRNAW